MRCVGLLLVGMLLASEAQASKLIAVLPLDTQMTEGKMTKAAQASLEEMLRDVATNELRPYGWTILSGENTIQVLRDNGVSPEQCGNQSCHLEMAREIKIEAFISGTVQYVEGEFTASIRLIETKTGSLLTSERVFGKTVKALRESFEAKADTFFTRSGLLQRENPTPDTTSAPPSVEGHRPQVKKGKVTEAVATLNVTAKPKDAVRLDLIDPNGAKTTSGAPYKNESATPGRWKVIARAADYEDEEQEIDVPADDVTSCDSI